jgi:hypothetical protein
MGGGGDGGGGDGGGGGSSAVGRAIDSARNTKGRSITVPLTSCLTGLDKSALQIKTNIVSWFHTS